MAINWEDFIGLVGRTNPPVTITRSPRIQNWWSNCDTTVTMSGSSFTINEDLLRCVTYGRGIPIDELQKFKKQDVIDTSDVQDFLNGIEVIAD